MELGTGLLIASAMVSILTYVLCYLVGLAVSRLWPRLRPSAKRRPRAWLVALVLWGCLGGGAPFVFEPQSSQADASPAIIAPSSP